MQQRRETHIKKMIDKTAKRKEQKKKIYEQKKDDSRKKSLVFYKDAVYRSKTDPNLIFGEDVSFGYGGFNVTDSHYRTVACSEFHEGGFLFEMVIPNDDSGCFEQFEYATSPIGDHHPGAGRGALSSDFLNITRIFYDPTEFKKSDKVSQNHFKFIQTLQITHPDIVMVHVNRSYIATNLPNTIRIKPTHPMNIESESKEEHAPSKPSSVVGLNLLAAPRETKSTPVPTPDSKTVVKK